MAKLIQSVVIFYIIILLLLNYPFVSMIINRDSIISVSAHSTDSTQVYNNHETNSVTNPLHRELSELEINELLSKLGHFYMYRSRPSSSNPNTNTNNANKAQQQDYYQEKDYLNYQNLRFNRDNSRSEKLGTDYGSYSDSGINKEIASLSKMPIKIEDDSHYPQSLSEENKNEQIMNVHLSEPNRNEANKFLNVNVNVPRQSTFQADKNPGQTMGPSSESSHIHGNIPEILVSIDSRIQKLQDMVYYRTMSNFGINSPACPSYFNLIKTQFLSLENFLESKLSSIEHKFSNMEIEDGIWKKTINWKLEEMSSKISQTENKISFTNEQLMNKLDLIERNFKVITNDFFAKFLLINEKLNKMELNFQAKLNDFESKIRKTFDYQQKLTNIFKQDFDSSVPENIFLQNNPTSINNHEDLDSQKPNKSQQKIEQWDIKNQKIPQSINLKENQSSFNRIKFNGSHLDSLMFTRDGHGKNMIDINMISNDQPEQQQNNSSTTWINQSDERGKMESNETTSNNNKLERFSIMSVLPQGTPIALNKTSIVGSHNNRNIDSVNSINDSEASFKNLSHTKSNGYEIKSIVNSEDLYAQCEQVFKRWKQNKFNPEDSHLLLSACKQLLSIENSNIVTNTDQMHSDVSLTLSSPEIKDRIEKRNSDEEIFIEQKMKGKEILINDRSNMNVDDILNNQANSNNENVPNNKLEELDSKLQYFSTKIIQIVQEMWHSSQTSQQYLKETLNVANRTKEIIKNEFTKLHHNMKPLSQINDLADEIRDPILTRLKEMSTAINNSVEIILNTQAQYIMRQDEQAHKILEIFINEVRNKTLSVNKKVQEQGNIVNRRFDQIYQNINQIGKKTIEGINMENLRLLDIFKSEMHILKSSLTKQNKISVNELEIDSPKSLPQNQCKNECFISRKEFENICFNIESKPYHFRSESLTLNNVSDIEFLERKNTSDIEINNGNNHTDNNEERTRHKFKRAAEIYFSKYEKIKHT